MVVHQHSLPLLFWADLLSCFELPWVHVDLLGYLISQRLRGCLQRHARNGSLGAFRMYSMRDTHLSLGALSLLFLDVHGQHLAAE